MKRQLFTALFASCVSIASAETIAYWRFGDQGLNDASGNGHTLVNANVDIDSSGAAIFNGTDACLETAEALDLSGYDKLTVECWVRPEMMDGDFSVLFQSYRKESDQTEPGAFVTYFSRDEHSFRSQLRDSSDKWTITCVTAKSGIPYQGSWHHVALVMDVSGMSTKSDKSKLYIDGVRQDGKDSTQVATIRCFLNQKFILGGGGEYVPDRFFRGMIDDVRITAGCLEPSEFLKFPTYGWSQSLENPAFAYWPFGRSGVSDVTGNGWDFVNQGGVSFANDHAYFNGSKSGLKVEKAFNVNPFSYSGLTYEFFFRTTADMGSDFAMLLENSGAYSQNPGSLHARLMENANNTIHAGIKTVSYSGFNSKQSRPGADDASAIDGAWHHVAIVYNPKADVASRFVAYFDGRMLPTNENPATDFADLNGDSSFFVGCRANGTHPFKGEMDDVRVMPWALTPAEFMKERSADAPVAHWKFNSPETALLDLSGNEHTLVNKNGVVFQDGYASFNGQNAHLVTSDEIDLSKDSQVTIEGLFYFEDTDNLGVLFDNGDVSKVGGFVVYGFTGSLFSQFRVVEDKTWNQWCWKSFGQAKNSWCHVALVVNLNNRSKTQSQVFVDGDVKENLLGNYHQTVSTLLKDYLAIGGGGSYGDSAWQQRQTSFKGRVAELMVTPQELKPEGFRLLKTRNPGEVILSPSAMPDESVVLDLANRVDLTVECFAQFPVEGSVGELFAFEPEGELQFRLAAAGGVLKAMVVPGSGGCNVETAVAPTDGGWHHVAMVVDGCAEGVSRVRLYVDYVQSSTHVERVNWLSSFAKGVLKVGDGFNGKVSSVRVTTGIVDPKDFLSERRKCGLTVIVR